jgi:hypothetical protein
MNTRILVAAALALGFLGSARAEQLLVTPSKSGNSYVASLDLVSSGKATGLEFHMTVPGLASSKAKIDVSRCASELPAGFAGQCSIAKGQVIGLVYSDSNALLPAGVVKIGTISISGAAEAKGNAAEQFKVISVLAADAKAIAIPTTAEVIDVDARSNVRGTEAK